MCVVCVCMCVCVFTDCGMGGLSSEDIPIISVFGLMLIKDSKKEIQKE